MRRTGAILAAGLWLCLAGSAGSAPSWRAPRTRWGAPDLQGLWTNLSLTRLERPPGASGRIVPDAEAPAVAAGLAKMLKSRPGDDIGHGETEWYESAELGRIDGRYRSSWLTHPADGRLPYRPQALKARMAAGAGVLDDPESLNASDRCLAPGWSAAGPPMLNGPATPNYRIMQTRDEVVIFIEVNHEVRHIRLGPHGPSSVRLWGGDSAGRWEGDTLVVETVNFHPAESYRPPLLYMSPEARVVERFTRISPTEIRYAFEVDDPKTFTQTWGGELPFRRTRADLIEYACHEGNYSVPGMLGGARREERDAAARRPR